MAKTIVSKANFLLLDEPTNHLDMHSVELLIEALNKYQNTGRIIAFKLNGTSTPLPARKIRDTVVPEPPAVILNNQITKVPTQSN